MNELTITIDKNDNIIIGGEVLRPFDALLLAECLKQLAINNLAKH